MDKQTLYNWLHYFNLKDVKVLSFDEYLKEPNRLQNVYIVNNQPSWRLGQHWVVLYKTELFDSYGLSPTFYGFPGITKYNTKIIQCNNSDKCGAYCLFYIVKRFRGMALDNICHTFSENVYKNDYFIMQNLINMHRS